MKWVQKKGIWITYDWEKRSYSYTKGAREWLGEEVETKPLWKYMAEQEMITAYGAQQLQNRMEQTAAEDSGQMAWTELLLRESSGKEVWYRIGMVRILEKPCVQITLMNIEAEKRAAAASHHRGKGKDKLTGLLDMDTFEQKVEKQYDACGRPDKRYAMFHLDICGFKAINEMFGVEAADRLLQYVGEVLRDVLADTELICRIGSDRFAAFVQGDRILWDSYSDSILEKIAQYELPYEVTCHIGIYEVGGEEISPTRMIDRALLAMSTIKDSYTVRHTYYTEEIRERMLSEQEIVGMVAAAIAEKQFVIYYQPQYSHSSGLLLGAEALVRWQHPDRGLISPGIFIPIFEKNGFITNLDLYVFEEVCRFQRECMDEGLPLAAISVNFSRRDIYMHDFVGRLERIRKKYDIPVNLLHLEITESAVVGNGQYIKEIVKELHRFDYVVEMDDFGSGYSSLNVLKDIPLDIIKLDMQFLARDTEGKRGGIILSSVVRMAKWLNIPVIAEGVETVAQADFLRSIGCDYVQGYLYSRPIPREAYTALLSGSQVGEKVSQVSMIETMDSANFWDPKSQETLIFNNYVGGAAVFAYDRKTGIVEPIRVNQKYLREMGMNMSEKEMIQSDFMGCFDEADRKVYVDTLDRCIASEEEQECETWRTVTSPCCGTEKLCIRSSARMIGRSGENFLFYVMIRNVTEEKRYYMQMQDNERRFKVASEQVNIYYWEYNVSTHEMRPCYRCMRDLGLPALLTNYPDSAIELGVFPPEIADFYRDWHKQIDSGQVKNLEAVLPLTVGRVPFSVRYTVEFDENNRPIKAYGSAALASEESHPGQVQATAEKGNEQ